MPNQDHNPLTCEKEEPCMDCEHPIKSKPLITHDHKCEECGKPATINEEGVIMRYTVKPNGDFVDGDVVDSVDDSSHFFCNDHYSR